jgi:integrase
MACKWIAESLENAPTGQRRDEVAGMRWDELSPDAHPWTLPRGRVKTDQGHEVPLSAAATAILKSIPRIADSPFVLTTNGTAPSSGYSKGKRKLDALLPPDMPAWRLHDLRRTVATGMARLGVNLPVTEKVLNHSSGSFAGIGKRCRCSRPVARGCSTTRRPSTSSRHWSAARCPAVATG